MAKVKTFRIHPQFGVPDQDVREFITACEENSIVQVNTQYIPSTKEGIDDRLTVIVTKLDDLPIKVSIDGILESSNIND